MNRGGAPKRDWVRVKPGERSASVPDKPDFDDQKLFTLLQSAKLEVQGLRVIHLHLSLLKDKSALDSASIKGAMEETAGNSAYLQTFILSNDDIIVLFKGIKFSIISDVCQKIEKTLLARTQMSKRNPFGEDSLYSISELSLTFVDLVRFVEGLTQDGAAGEDQREAKPPITVEELSKLERAVKMFDLSPFMLNQPIVNITNGEQTEYEYFELYIAIKSLEDRLSPDYDIISNKWLFGYFTSILDSAVLRVLNYGVDFLRGRRIGLNLNLSTILSDSFVRFDERLTADLRGNVVLEINKVDLIENVDAYKDAVDFVSARGYRLCIDGLDDFLATRLDLEYLGADYAKIIWSDEMAQMSKSELEAFERRTKEQRNCKFILARCGSMDGLKFAEKMGISLAQGRIVDNILRKNLLVREALKTARVLSDD